MNPAEQIRPLHGLEALVRHPLVIRVASLGIAGIVAIPLFLATRLTPDLSGHGTHMQLGLSPCTILQTTGYPCPMCGATTAWALMADLRVGSAFYVQPFGAFLFLVAIAAVALGLAEAVQPRARWSRLRDLVAAHDRLVGGTLLAAMFLGWTWKLALMQGWV